jgi:anti-sigma B factor antagonist
VDDLCDDWLAGGRKPCARSQRRSATGHHSDQRGESRVNLSVSTEDVDGHRVVSVRGEVDVYSAPTLRKCLQESMDEQYNDLIVDLTDIAFIDSTGLGVLVAGQNRAGELGGKLSVVCSQERVLKLFRITGLDEVFAIHPTRDEALSAGR